MYLKASCFFVERRRPCPERSCLPEELTVKAGGFWGTLISPSEVPGTVGSEVEPKDPLRMDNRHFLGLAPAQRPR